MNMTSRIGATAEEAKYLLSTVKRVRLRIEISRTSIMRQFSHTWIRRPLNIR